MTVCSLALFQACWEPAETFGWEDPIQIRCPSQRHPSPLCQAKPPLQTRLFPPGHSTSAPCRSKSCPLVPSISLLAAPPPSPHVYLPVRPTDSSGSSSTEEGHPSFVCFCGFLLALRMEEHFLLPGRRGNWLCVVMDSVPSFLCSDRPCFAMVSF